MAKQIDAANAPAEPLKRLKLLGPEPFGGTFGAAFAKYGECNARSDCLVLGDGERTIKKEEIEAIKDRIGPDTIIELSGHGLVERGQHLITLFEETPNTSEVLKFFDELIPYPLQIFVASCYGGAANGDISLLKEGSKLVTVTEPDDVSIGGAAEMHLRDNAHFTLSLEERFLRSIRTGSQVLTFNQKLSSGEIFKYQYRPFRNQLITETRTAQEFIKRAEEDFTKICKDKLEIELPKLPEVTEEQAKLALVEHIAFLIQVDKLDKKPNLVKFLPSVCNAKDQAGDPFLYQAALKSKKAFNLLIQAGADVNALDHDGNPIIFSATYVSSAAFKLFLEAGADVNVKDENGTPVIYLAAEVAAIINLPSFFNQFFQAGADVNAKDGKGDPIICRAAKRTNKGAFRLLLENGADPFIPGRDGRNAFDLIENKPELKKIFNEYKAALSRELETQKEKKQQYDSLWLDLLKYEKVTEEDIKKLEDKYVLLLTTEEKEKFYKEQGRQVPLALEKTSEMPAIPVN